MRGWRQLIEHYLCTLEQQKRIDGIKNMTRAEEKSKENKTVVIAPGHTKAVTKSQQVCALHVNVCGCVHLYFMHALYGVSKKRKWFNGPFISNTLLTP